MNDHFGKIKINRLSKAWAETTVIWPGELMVEGEDEEMVLNFIIIWRHLKVIKHDRCPLIWNHISKNLDEIIKKWLLIQTNCFSLKNLQYFSTCVIMIVMDLIWKSNINVTILRKYRPVLKKASNDLEKFFRGGFRKMVAVRVIHKASPVREDNLLRKIVRKYYAVKATVLVQMWASRLDLEEFINIHLQISDQVSQLYHHFFHFSLPLVSSIILRA